MTQPRSRASAWRIVIIAAMVALLEGLCRTGVITHLTMPPPSEIVRDLFRILLSGSMNTAMIKTLGNVTVAFVLSVVVGVSLGVAIHPWRGLRDALEPLFATWYAVPVYAFYPLFIILFGLGDKPQILIGFMLAMIAVVVSTLGGLDRVPRVLRRTARMHRMGPVATALRITLPCAAPFLFTGVKLALSYAFIGVVGAEFILSRDGLGYEINFAFNNFDNGVMYPLILLILLIATTLNMTLHHWERSLLARRSRG
jgi:NitT/TauT family transport system permease protein